MEERNESFYCAFEEVKEIVQYTFLKEYSGTIIKGQNKALKNKISSSTYLRFEGRFTFSIIVNENGSHCGKIGWYFSSEEVIEVYKKYELDEFEVCCKEWRDSDVKPAKR
jgi:hypothetical protein